MVEKTIPAARLRVFIPGAGIAGNCLAYWLSRTRLDISITIVERSPVPRVTGQSIDIRGSAIDIIKEMKLEEAIRRERLSLNSRLVSRSLLNTKS